MGLYIYFSIKIIFTGQYLKISGPDSMMFGKDIAGRMKSLEGCSWLLLKPKYRLLKVVEEGTNGIGK